MSIGHLAEVRLHCKLTERCGANQDLVVKALCLGLQKWNCNVRSGKPREFESHGAQDIFAIQNALSWRKTNRYFAP